MTKNVTYVKKKKNNNFKTNLYFAMIIFYIINNNNCFYYLGVCLRLVAYRYRMLNETSALRAHAYPLSSSQGTFLDHTYKFINYISQMKKNTPFVFLLLKSI